MIIDIIKAFVGGGPGGVLWFNCGEINVECLTQQSPWNKMFFFDRKDFFYYIMNESKRGGRVGKLLLML